ncbi:RagB/SusD family nutrient uptake outer membrane protein [Pedobacter sp. GR22-6]|uniref:RagB/SusD family nutrient uptake outer membrane protein n=1 Tax=Pedobacter sp. GR22-6 TaxID=3127957 RepID=UPI00307ED4B8
MKNWIFIIGIAGCFAIQSCKEEFLDKKPSSDIITPTTLAELRGLLENEGPINKTAGLPQISADEYNVVSTESYLALPTAIERNAYIWTKDLYEDEQVLDWEVPFKSIFIANSVLDVLRSKNFTDKTESDRVKGWALFVRAWAYFDLARNFCKTYNPETAPTDLGLPIRLSAGIDVINQRSSLQLTMDQVLSDLSASSQLLAPNIQILNKNRPSKAAAFALKARIYLYMGNYQAANRYCDSTLIINNKLIDYNSVSKTASFPFSANAEEVIYFATHIVAYSSNITSRTSTSYEVKPELYQLFHENDLRKQLFFKPNALGKITMKPGYISIGGYPFTGLATDEIYLIKAECLARNGSGTEALNFLNALLLKRYANSARFEPISSGDPATILSLVIQERRKQLIWRSVRWSDLKRYNRDGANIILSRTINNSTYTLPANDPRYVFPIPNQEIRFSNIEQNPR